MVKNFVELDKSLSTPVDTARTWGSIDIRLVVASKKAEETGPLVLVEEADDVEGDLPLEGSGPLDSYLERPKGKGFLVFLVNGQRHDVLDESFVGRELGFKYLRARTMIIVDADNLAPEAIAQIVQGSRQGFYKGEVYSAILSRMVYILKGDPDLKRLESDAEQEISELRSGDAAVKGKLDQLIEGHHTASAHEIQQATGPQGIGTGSGAVAAVAYVVQADPTIGAPAAGPVLVTDPAGASIRLHPNEARSLFVSTDPPEAWASVTSFQTQADPGVPELKILEQESDNGKGISLIFKEPDDFPAEDYPVITTLSCVAQLDGHEEPRLLKREVMISQRHPRPPRPVPTLRPMPTFLRIVSRQPVQLHLDGPATHVRMRWDGEDDLVTGHPAQWRFHARCTTLPTYPTPVFTEPRRGNFEVIVDSPQGLASKQELTFQIEAIGPTGELLATPFKGVVSEPAAEPEARKISDASSALGSLRRPPYDLRIITQEEWASRTCWGATEWTQEDAGSYNEPTQSSSLVLIINQDIEVLRNATEAMLKRKLDEKTIQHRMNSYIAHIAYHLWQMYQQTQATKEEHALDESVRPPEDDQLRAEINRVASTVINLMEH